MPFRRPNRCFGQAKRDRQPGFVARLQHRLGIRQGDDFFGKRRNIQIKRAGLQFFFSRVNAPTGIQLIEVGEVVVIDHTEFAFGQINCLDPNRSVAALDLPGFGLYRSVSKHRPVDAKRIAAIGKEGLASVVELTEIHYQLGTGCGLLLVKSELARI